MNQCVANVNVNVSVRPRVVVVVVVDDASTRRRDHDHDASNHADDDDDDDDDGTMNRDDTRTSHTDASSPWRSVDATVAPKPRRGTDSTNIRRCVRAMRARDVDADAWTRRAR